MRFFKSSFLVFFLILVLVPHNTQAHQENFDRLLVQVRGRADAYYQSDLVPRAEGLDSDFDPLAEVLARCDNVEIDAWLNVYYLWTGATLPADERHPALKRSWPIKDNLGRPVATYSALEQSQHWLEGIYTDPASEDYRCYFAAAVVELVQKYPVRGIHLDFTRYPGSFFGAGGRLAQDFEKKYGLAVRELPEKLSRQDFAAWLNGSLPRELRRHITARIIWDYLRATEVSKLVATVRSALMAARPGIRLSVSVFPDPVEAFLDKGQDWPGWLRAGIVDELFIMDYFGDKNRVQALYDEVVQVVGSTERLWLGLGSYIKSPEDIGEEISLCAGGDQAACFFSLGHFLSQGKSVRAYVDIVRKQQGAAQIDQEVKTASLLATGLEQVKQCLAAKVTASCTGEDDFNSVIGDQGERRAASHEKSQPWLDVRGIFRYVNPYDGLEKVEEQLKFSQDSYDLLVEGQSFDEVAQEYSQAGSRFYGGVLPRLFLRKDNRLDQILAELEPGQVSPVIPVYNSFWVYQILDKGRL